MTTKIFFKAMSDGRIVHKTIPIEHPKFDVIPSDVFLGYELPAQSVQSQVIDYLDSIDKSDIMEKYGFDVILDYYPKKHKVRKQRIDEVADCFNKVSKCLYNFSWTIKKSNRAFRIITNWIKTGRYRYRTGIQPKWSNRTRKKQRLTRLQRRHKRQRK